MLTHFIDAGNGSSKSAEKYSQLFVESGLYKPKKVSKDELEKAKIIINDLLNKEPIPFNKVCQALGMSERVLKSALPVLSLQLKTKFKEYDKNERESAGI